MPEAAAGNQDFWQSAWPDTRTPTGAAAATRIGYWCAYAFAVVECAKAAIAVWGPVAPGASAAPRLPVAEGVTTATLLAFLGFGIQRRSRIAAIASLLLLLSGLLVPLIGGRLPRLGGGDLIMLLCFANGVRGAFASHRLAHSQNDTHGMAPG
jgi:hypothetical protein